jgi:hypothetical protein
MAAGARERRFAIHLAFAQHGGRGGPMQSARHAMRLALVGTLVIEWSNAIVDPPN